MTSAVPDRLLTNGRPADQEFLEDEVLYMCWVDYGFQPSQLPVDQLANAVVREQFRLPTFFRIPNQSFNRSKFCDPLDVLYSFTPDHGVLSFPHKAATAEYEHPFEDKGRAMVRRFAFVPTHVPLEQNYAHAEAWVYRDGQLVKHDRGKTINDGIKDRYRKRLGDAATLVKMAAPRAQAPDP